MDFVFHLYHKGCHGLSNADETVYPVGKVSQASWDVPGWLDAKARFFQEKDLQIRDREE